MSGYLEQGPMALAHRGGAGLAVNRGLENTLEAFRNAVRLGYRYLETDVRASRDGTAFVFHDEDLGRMLGEGAAFADLTAAEVRSATLASGASIPSLAELLEELPQVRLNVDVKSDAVLTPALEVIRAAGAGDRVLIASFSGARLLRVRRLAPGVATGAGPAEIAALRLGGPGAWHRARRAGAVCVQVPVRHRGLRILTPGFIRRAHADGLQVHVWTIDDPAQMGALLDAGVDGIISDRPDVLKDVLVARGQWHGA